MEMHLVLEWIYLVQFDVLDTAICPPRCLNGWGAFTVSFKSWFLEKVFLQLFPLGSEGPWQVKSRDDAATR